MISIGEAQKILAVNARSFGKEEIGLDQADGRTLAQPILADRDYPPFNRSSMDGYAIRHSDFAQGIRQFVVTGAIYAGETTVKTLREGECYKIMTGAPVPAPADTVIRKEDVEEGGEAIHVGLDTCRPFQNISRQGEDLRAGDTAIGSACICEPPITGLLASLGKHRLVVERLPRVGLLTTGNEVVSADAVVRPAQIRNSNRWLLQSCLKKWGIIPGHYEHIPDDRPLLKASLAILLGAAGLPAALPPFDILILSGGVSAGDADYVPGVLEELGVRKLFHKVAIKPGKPVWCGLALAPAASPTHAPATGPTPAPATGPTPGSPAPSAPSAPSHQTMVFALPGNPFSCLVNFEVLIRPFLHSCFGLPSPPVMELPLLDFKKKHTPLDEFFPVRLAGGAQGQTSGLVQVPINSSGDIRLALHADGLALHPADRKDLSEGTTISYYIF